MLWDAVCPRTTEANTTSAKTDTNLAPLWGMGLLSPKGMLGVGHFLDISRQACGLLIFMYNEGPPSPGYHAPALTLGPAVESCKLQQDTAASMFLHVFP